MTKYLEIMASRSALAGIHIETLPNPWYLPRYREFGNLDDRVSLNVRSLSGRHRHRHRHRRQVRLSRRLLPRSLDLKRLAGWLRWPMAAAMVEAVSTAGSPRSCWQPQRATSEVLRTRLLLGGAHRYFAVP